MAARLGPARSWPASLNGWSGPCKQARENLGPVRSLTEPTERIEGASRRHGWGVVGACRRLARSMAGAWQVRGKGVVAQAWRGRKKPPLSTSAATGPSSAQPLDSMAPKTMSIRRATLGSVVPANEIDLGGPTSPHRPSSLLSLFTGRRARFVTDELPPVFFFVM